MEFPPSPELCPDCHTPLPPGTAALLCPVCALDPGGYPDTSSQGPLQLGDWELGEELAQGGMGVVYEAWQPSLRRRAAVKLLTSPLFAPEASRQRFQREAEAVARLSHPGIITIHAVGETHGQPWLAMDLIPGGTLAGLLEKAGGHLPPLRSAQLIRDIALAVAHAHARGVVHRDLKPSNILLTLEGQPVLTDFGLASLTDDTAQLTLTAASLAGTPASLPPERASGQAGRGASPAEDVYGLGVLLYHCLTGRPPFMADSLTALLAAVCQDDPVPPRQLNRSVPADLETVCLRCLEKSPAARCASAAEVAEEMQRWLEHRPVRSRPVGPVSRMVRMARRNPVAATLTTLLALAILGGTTAAALGWRAAAQGQARLAAEAEQRRVELYSADLAAAATAILPGGNPATGLDWLERCLPGPGQADLRGPEWPLLKALISPHWLAEAPAAHAHILTTLTWHPDGKQLLSGAHDGSLRLWEWDATSHKLTPRQQILPAGTPRLQQAQWMADGSGFLTAESGARIRLREPGNPQPKWEIAGAQFSLAPAAELMVVSGAPPFYYDPPGTVTLWELAKGMPPRLLQTLTDSGRAVVLSPDGRFVAWADASDREKEHNIRLWDRQQPDRPPHVLTTKAPVWALSVSPDSRQLAVACFAKPQVLRFDLLTGQSLPALTGHQLGVWSLTWTGPEQLLTTSSDRSVRSWNLSGPSPVAQSLPFAHQDEIWSASLSPDHSVLATGDKKGTLRLHPLPLPRPLPESALTWPQHRYLTVAFDAASLSLSGMPGTGGPALRRPLDGQPTTPLTAEPAPPGHEWTGFDATGLPLYWDPARGLLRRPGGTPDSWQIPSASSAGNPEPLCWPEGRLAAGRYFLTLRRNGDAVRLDLTDGSSLTVSNFLLPGVSPRMLALSRTGRYAVTATWSELVLHDFATGRTQRLDNDPHWARDAAFSPDDSLMATAGIDARIQLRQLPDATLLHTFSGHLEEASGVDFSPDGRTLVSTEIGSGLRFWRLDSRREVLHLPLPRAAETVRFSPDGRWLAVVLCAASEDPEKGTVTLLPCAALPLTGR